MGFEPLQKTRLFEGIVKQIQSQIKDGTLKSGDRLPSERELSDKLNVSRVSVREALRTLEIMGYVDIKAGEGVFVKEVKLDDLLEPITTAISIDKALILDLLDLRDVIEIATAKRAAIYADKIDLKKIYSALQVGEREIAEGKIGLYSDSMFHIAIAEATHNSMFSFVMNLISDLLNKSREATLEIPGQPTRTQIDHKMIFEAIAQQDADEASRLMREHIQKAKINITRIVEEADSNIKKIALTQ